MYRVPRRNRTPAPFFVLPLVAIVLVAVGCKTSPGTVKTEPDAPSVTPATTTDAETVRETPMAEVQEQETQVARSMDADEINRSGVLKTIYFDFDKYEIRPDQRPALRANAEWLKGPGAKFRVVIEGHCDERGTNEYNMALGDKRANAARQYLISLGVPASRIRTISYGEERPADPGHNETAWARNRRSEFLVEEG